MAGTGTGRLSSRHPGKLTGVRCQVQRIVLAGPYVDWPAGCPPSSAENQAMSEAASEDGAPIPSRTAVAHALAWAPVPMLVSAGSCMFTGPLPPPQPDSGKTAAASSSPAANLAANLKATASRTSTTSVSGR